MALSENAALFNGSFVRAMAKDAGSLNELRVRMGLLAQALDQGTLQVEFEAGKLAGSIGCGGTCGKKDLLLAILADLARSGRVTFNPEGRATLLPVASWTGIRPLGKEGPSQRPLHFGDGLPEALGQVAWEADRAPVPVPRQLLPQPQRRNQNAVNRKTDELCTLTALAGSKGTQLTVNRKLESELMARLARLVEDPALRGIPGDMAKWGGNWRLDWVRKVPQELGRALKIIEEKVKEGWVPHTNMGAAIKDMTRRLMARWGQAAK